MKSSYNVSMTIITTLFMLACVYLIVSIRVALPKKPRQENANGTVE